jgi:hypothetical protein
MGFITFNYDSYWFLYFFLMTEWNRQKEDLKSGEKMRFSLF